MRIATALALFALPVACATKLTPGDFAGSWKVALATPLAAQPFAGTLTVDDGGTITAGALQSPSINGAVLHVLDGGFTATDPSGLGFQVVLRDDLNGTLTAAGRMATALDSFDASGTYVDANAADGGGAATFQGSRL